MKSTSVVLKTSLWILLAISSYAFSDENCLKNSSDECSALVTNETRACCYLAPSIEIKAGYFFFTNSKLKKIYDQGGLNIQLSASYPLWNLANSWTINAYGAVEYFEMSGRSINARQKTTLWSLPVNIGLKALYEVNDSIQYYLAIGPRCFYLHQHNDSSFVSKNRSRNGVGLFVNTGINYVFCNHLMIDIFGEYSYANVHFKEKCRTYTRNIQFEGFTVGAGLGYEF